MQSKENRAPGKENSLSNALEASSLVLLGVFLVSILVKLLPLKPTNALWQLGIASKIVNNGSVALVGVLLTFLALEVNKDSKRIRKRRDAFRRWSAAATLGFLLLAPLQVFNTWRVYQSYTSRAEQQTSQSAEKLAGLREAIASATSHKELQERLKSIVGPQIVLTQSQLATPINQLKTVLLQKTEKLSSLLQQKIEYQSSIKPDGLISETVRVALTALLYATGFAYIGGLLPRSRKQGLAFGWSSTKKK